MDQGEPFHLIDWPAEHAAYFDLVEEAVVVSRRVLNRLTHGPPYEEGDLDAEGFHLLAEFIAPGALDRVAIPKQQGET